MDRKKELKEQYRQMKPEMGLFLIRSSINNKYYLEATHNLKGSMNGTLFKLDSGLHPNKELQKEWTEYGKGSFTIEIIDRLEYDKDDEIRNDYTEELEIMYMEWEQKLAKEKLTGYSKRINK